MQSKKTRILVNTILCIIIASCCFAVYKNTLGFDFVYDDLVFVQHNPNLSDTKNIPLLLTSKYFHISGERTYRPANTLTYMIDRKIWGQNAYGYHLTNVIMHTATALLLFFIGTILCGSSTGGFFAAMLFAMHPMNTEAVAPVSFREDIMALGFVLAAFLAYISKRATKPDDISTKKSICPMRTAAIAILFFLGLASKETAIVLPLLIVVYEATFSSGEPVIERIKRIAPTMAAIAISGGIFFYLYFTLPTAGSSPVAEYPAQTTSQSAVIMLQAFSNYIRIAFYPINLCADYLGKFVLPLPQGLVLLLIALPLSMLYFTFVVRREYPATAFGMLFFFTALLPVSNIIPFGAIFTERYAYMPGAGLALAVSCLFFEREKIQPGCVAPKTHAPIFYIFFLSAACIFCGIAASQRNNVWKNEFSLWKNTVDCCPTSPRAQTNLGRALLERNLVIDALPYLEKAADLDPDNYEARNALGTAYQKTGRQYEAIREFSEAIRIKPEAKYTYYNLALVYSETGNLMKAERWLKQALALDPNYIEAQFALGNIILKQGHPAEAAVILKNVLQQNPKHPGARGALAIAFMQLGNLDSAETLLTELLTELPEKSLSYIAAKSNLSKLKTLKKGSIR